MTDDTEHELVEVEHTEHALSVEDGEITVTETGTERTKQVVCKTCDERFESDSAAKFHVQDTEHPSATAIMEQSSHFDVVNIEERGAESVQIDLEYTTGEFSGKVPLAVFRAVAGTGHRVTGTHTGAEPDARLWVSANKL